MIKYLVSDLDGTLLKSNDVILEDDIKAINDFVDCGGQLWIASGRGTSYIKELNEKGVWPKYMFGSTGSVLFDGQKDIILSKINRDLAFEIMDYLDSVKDTDYCLDIPVNKPYAKAEYGCYYKHMRTDEAFETLDPRSYFDHEDFMYKFFVICANDDIAYSILNYIENHFDGNIKAFHADYGCLEIVDAKTNKWYAIKYLIDQLGIKKEEIACIGDEENDILMIENAGVGFAMESASDYVKSHADYIVKGVKEAIEICKGGRNV